MHITKQSLSNFKEYLYQRDYSANTIKKYVYDVEQYANYCDLNGEPEFVQYKQYLLDKQISPTVINSYIVSINSYLKYENNPNTIKCLKIQEKYFDNCISKDDYYKLLLYSNDKEKLLLMFLANTGIRVSEVQYITIDAIHSKKLKVWNKQKYREILLIDELVSLANEYITSNNIKQYLFCSVSGKPYTRQQIWKIVKDIADKSNISNVTTHSFRKLFATEYYNKTHNLIDLANILGHSSLNTTKRYIKTDVNKQMNIIESLKLF